MEDLDDNDLTEMKNFYRYSQKQTFGERLQEQVKYAIKTNEWQDPTNIQVSLLVKDMAISSLQEIINEEIVLRDDLEKDKLWSLI